MGMAAILIMWPGLFINTLVPSSYRCFIYKLALIGQADSEEKIFEIVDGRWTDDGRSPDHGHHISSPCEPNGSGELENTKPYIRYKQHKNSTPKHKTIRTTTEVLQWLRIDSDSISVSD